MLSFANKVVKVQPQKFVRSLYGVTKDVTIFLMKGNENFFNQKLPTMEIEGAVFWQQIFAVSQTRWYLSNKFFFNFKCRMFFYEKLKLEFFIQKLKV